MPGTDGRERGARHDLWLPSDASRVPGVRDCRGLTPCCLHGLLWLLLILGSACGPAPEPGPGFLRLQLEPEQRGESLEAPHNVTFVLTDELTRWKFLKQSASLWPAADGRPARMIFGATKQQGPLRITRLGALNMAGVRGLRVMASFSGHGSLQVGLLSGGKVVGLSLPRQLVQSEQPVAINLVLGAKSRDLPDIDGLRFVCRGTKRRLGLVSVELMSEYDLASLPFPGGHVLLGEVWREGRSVVTGAPLVVQVTPGAESQLAFSVGLPRSLARPEGAEPDTLRVSLVWQGQTLDQRVFDVDTRQARRHRRWLDVRWSLGSYAGLELTLRFEMDPGPGGGDAAAIVAEARLEHAREQMPLVLLITSDTHRADHLGAAGADWLQTPVLDALAARGALFLDCYSPTNVTGPAHQAMLTGWHPRDLPPVKNSVVLGELMPTLAERFAAAGWRTLAVVSAKHLGHKFSGLGRGFDRLSRPESTMRDGAASVALLERWLEAEAGHPLFVWLHLFDAHAPYEPSAEFDRLYYDATRDPFALDFGHPGPMAPRDMPGLKDMSYARAQYAAEVTGLDALLEPLLELPRVRAGVVAFVGDHGEGLGQYDVHFDHAELYPETVAVPLILTAPAITPGTLDERPVLSLDLGRTLLDLAGLGEVPFPGRSLLSEARAGPRFVISSGGRSALAVDGPWMLRLQLTEHHGTYTSRGYALHETELFDRVADPACRRELSAEQPERTRAMRAGLVAWLSRASTEGQGEALEDEDTGAMLAELGYAGMTEMKASVLWVPDECESCRRWEPRR